MAIYFPFWEKYAEWNNIDILSIDEHEALNFIAYCYQFTHLNSDLASKALTAAISFHKLMVSLLIENRNHQLKDILMDIAVGDHHKGDQNCHFRNFMYKKHLYIVLINSIMKIS